MMYRVISKGLILAGLSTPLAAEEKLLSYSDIELGIESISYHETIEQFEGYGELKQSIQVLNPTTRNSAYIALSEKFGLYLDGAATFAPSIETETWSLGEFGDIQQNDFKIEQNELAFRVSYKMTEQHRVILGVRLSSLDFIRSHFEYVQPGADAFNAKLKEDFPDDETKQFYLPGHGVEERYRSHIAVSESQDEFMGVISYRYEPNERPGVGNFSWYFGTELAIPAYSVIQNTTIEGESLEATFNGYSLMAKLGLRYQVVDHLSLLATVSGYYKYRDVVTKHYQGDAKVSVPEVELYNNAFTLGLRWAY
ncbi:hypothetical protein [Gayadomonas joobiniege]|uniref:hypothetical protein n=1 Tax=Gayadomonas joobiniege TaxID=1234606 RepID=UPI00036F24D6|nr:hypothetical protein [Gayadomonas joobiniege]